MQQIITKQTTIDAADTEATNPCGNHATPPELDFPTFIPLCVNMPHNSSYFNIEQPNSLGGYIWQPNPDMYLYMCGV